jgi:hypothetical protein
MCPDTEFAMQNGKDLYSPSGEFRLAFQSDGNLVLYQKGWWDSAIWDSKAWPNWGGGFKFQGDGHAIIYNGNNLKWKNDRNGNPNSFLVVQNDGNLVQYDRGTLKPIWSSNSARNGKQSNIAVSELAKQCFTASPTLNPIPSPTEKPSAKPTEFPISNPTKAPTTDIDNFKGKEALGSTNGVKFGWNDNVSKLGYMNGPKCGPKGALSYVRLSYHQEWLFWDKQW